MINNRDVLSVTELVQIARKTIKNEKELKNVALVGELSNFTAHYSGHFYFTLKDENSRIECVMFKSWANKVLFKPKDGDKVIVHGYCDIFLNAGKLQLYIERMNLDGLGDLHLRFEALKKELYTKGYFDQKMKKELPRFPNNIGIIAARKSAAHADIVKTLTKRWPVSQQTNYYASVQGIKAVPSLIKAIHQANIDEVDVIILARGGGSIEDLWAFNELELIQAVLASKVPIISGVGHESDTTLVDLAADKRAATPTAAAVEAVPDQIELYEQLRKFKNHYYIQIRKHYLDRLKEVAQIEKSSPLFYPEKFFNYKQQLLDVYSFTIAKFSHEISKYASELKQHEELFLKLFRIFISSKDKEINDYKRNMILNMNRLLAHAQSDYKRLSFYDNSSETLVRKIKRELAHIKTIHSFLNTYDPEKMLIKGYSIVKRNDEIIKSINTISRNDKLEVLLQDGIIDVKVENIKEAENNGQKNKF